MPLVVYAVQERFGVNADLKVNRLGAPVPPVGLLVVLFGLIPVLALLVCGTVIWRTNLTVGVGWMFSTMLAMAFQVGILFVVIRSFLLTAISYAQ